VLRIRDVYLSLIPDPNFFHPGSRVKKIAESRIWICIRIKEFKYFNSKKCFLSSRKYDPSYSFRNRIPDPDPDCLPIPDPGSRGQKGTGSRILIRNTTYIIQNRKSILFLKNFVTRPFICQEVLAVLWIRIHL